MRTSLLFTLSAAALAATSSAHAETHETRQHDAHQHGLVEWFIVQDGNELLAEIVAPGSDIVGFEHAPESAEQTTAIERAVAMLSKPDALFKLNPDAGCQREAQSVSHSLKNAHEEHGAHHDNHHHDEHHDSHEHEEHHAHDDHHDDHHGQEHDDHSEHHDKARHGSFSAQYTFHCKTPARIASVSTDWFTVFPNTEKVSIQAISDKGATTAELTPSSITFRF